MYGFLDHLSEMVERYSWAIVPSVVGGALAVFLLWGRVPIKKVLPWKILRVIILIGLFVGGGIGFASKPIAEYLGINQWLIGGMGLALFYLCLWRL